MKKWCFFVFFRVVWSASVPVCGAAIAAVEAAAAAAQRWRGRISLGGNAPTLRLIVFLPFFLGGGRGGHGRSRLCFRKQRQRSNCAEPQPLNNVTQNSLSTRSIGGISFLRLVFLCPSLSLHFSAAVGL